MNDDAYFNGNDSPNNPSGWKGVIIGAIVLFATVLGVHLFR